MSVLFVLNLKDTIWEKGFAFLKIEHNTIYSCTLWENKDSINKSQEALGRSSISVREPVLNSKRRIGQDTNSTEFQNSGIFKKYSFFFLDCWNNTRGLVCHSLPRWRQGYARASSHQFKIWDCVRLFPNSAFSNFALMAWNQPWWEDLYRGNWQMLQIRDFPSSHRELAVKHGDI